MCYGPGGTLGNVENPRTSDTVYLPLPKVCVNDSIPKFTFIFKTIQNNIKKSSSEIYILVYGFFWQSRADLYPLANFSKGTLKIIIYD